MHTPTRTLVVWCPDWPVVVHRRPSDAAVAVVHANRVVAASGVARHQGVRCGLRRREAQGRCPGLEVIERDLALEARHFEPVMAALDAVTPRIEVLFPGTCAFATRGPSRYFGGDEALAARVVEVVATALSQRDPGRGGCRVGVADGVFAARLAARTRGEAITVVAPGESASFLAPLGVTLLDHELTDLFVRLGLHTLGALAELTAADMVGRFGAEGERLHRLARGLDDRPPAPGRVPPDLEVVAELDPPVERVDQATFLAKALADELEERLERRGVMCTRVLVTAETEHGEELARLWRHEGALSAVAVAERMRWQLDGWLHAGPAARPTAGLVRLGLRPDEVVPARGRQLGFWGGQTAATDRVARAVARVQGLLGPRSVQVPERRGGRGPADQVARVPAEVVELDGEKARIDARFAHRPWPGRLPPPFPATVPPLPQPAELVDEQRRPVGVSGRGELSAPPRWLSVAGSAWIEVQAWAGPWPVDERWWDPPVHRRRARFQVVTADGRARLLALESRRWSVEALYD